ncbi:MAG: hypothetical protein WD512_16810 [Candidatus Paceibacterota bacterium]
MKTLKKEFEELFNQRLPDQSSTEHSISLPDDIKIKRCEQAILKIAQQIDNMENYGLM